ncbi:hypothetical protein [uncultured Winogradskyella sp.]|uniref:hypothetical protein n=1 Tax=uncultured Winogradskyella sp. TaxID=395353 RepID=UPI0030D748F0|tara:strand:+ start:313 stop:813 length:501 start_codon:yes stop_codon:yes gene_type:complete
MDSQEVLNIVSIVISTILSVGAIILSFWFYRESNKQNKETGLMQVDIKNAIEKLEKLSDRTYTDTFGALKSQMDLMQKHIFTSSVGETNTSEPDKLKFYILGYLSDKKETSLEKLCSESKSYTKTEITELIYSFHREGIVNFDGQKVQYLKTLEQTSQEIKGSEHE